MKKLLIVVDYQKDFVDGALGFSGAEKLEPLIVNRIEQANNENEDVVFTKDVHSKDYLMSEEGKNLPVEHCIKNSEGSMLFGRLEEISKKYPCFEKPSFGSLDLGEYLKNKSYQQVTIIGLVSYICVFSNAIIAKAALPNAHIVVEKNLTSAADLHAQEVGFEALKNLHIEIK